MPVRIALPSFRRKPATEIRSTFFSETLGSLTLDHVNLAGDARLGFDPTAELNSFQASEVIYRCVDLITTELAGLDLALEKAGGEGNEYIEDDAVANLFNNASSDAGNAVAMKRIMWRGWNKRAKRSSIWTAGPRVKAYQATSL